MIEMSGTINTNPDEEYKPYFSGEDEYEDYEDETDHTPPSPLIDFKPPLRRKHRGRPKKFTEQGNLIPKRPRGRPRKFPIMGK